MCGEGRGPQLRKILQRALRLSGLICLSYGFEKAGTILLKETLVERKSQKTTPTHHDHEANWEIPVENASRKSQIEGRCAL
jgi:hypothetical protein